MFSRRYVIGGAVVGLCALAYSERRPLRTAWWERRRHMSTLANWVGVSSPLLKAGITLTESQLRTDLITEVFSGAGLPAASTFTTSTLNTTDPLASYSLSPSNLGQYDQHTLDIKDNSNVTVSTDTIGIWRPTSGTKNNKVVIQLLGHNTFTGSLDPAQGTHGNLVQEQVQAGYTVCLIEMGVGDSPTTHNALPAPTSSLNPLRYFLTAPIVALNKFIAEGTFTHKFLCGHSGGGWATVLCAAMDTRFEASWANAGSWPLYMTVVSPGRDYEQLLPVHGRSIANLASVDYTDLYVLCCHSARKHRQSTNTLDDYFTQANYNAAAPYRDIVRNTAANSGGSFDLTFYTATGHFYATQCRADMITLWNTF